MPRFKMNRWWTLVLALVLGVAGSLSVPTVGRADGGRVAVDNPGDPSGPGGTPTGTGDPDSPSNSGKSQRQLRGQAGRGTSPDLGGVKTPDLAVRLRVAMQILRLYFLRF